MKFTTTGRRQRTVLCDLCAVCGFVVVITSCASLYFKAVEPPPKTFQIDCIEKLPCRDLRQGFVFTGEKVGFTHLRIEPSSERGHFCVTSTAHR